MLKLDLVEVGNSLGLVLPKEVLARLNVAEGDYLVLNEDEGGYRIAPFAASKSPRTEN